MLARASRTPPTPSNQPTKARSQPVQAKSKTKTFSEHELLAQERPAAPPRQPGPGFGDIPPFPEAKQENKNRTGLPADLKSGIEKLSGVSLNNVNVHYNSVQPARLQAFAYTRGADIHVAPGQERHLAHEAWHVVQQSQGRSKATTQTAGVPVNNEAALEQEAEVMGSLASPGASARAARQDVASGAVAAVPASSKGGPGSSAQNGLPNSGVVQKYDFSDEDMAKFHQKQKEERQKELQGLNTGFVMGNKYQPGPVMRGAMGLARSRFDLSDVEEGDRDNVEHALSMGTDSPSQNQVVAGVGMDLFGRMLRNVGRLKEDNTVRELANMSGSPYYQPFKPKTDPSKAVGAESAKLKIGVNRAQAPHYSHEENSISLMNPEQMDQTGHELQHARDQLHGDLDLFKPEHRLASELNAFTRQQRVSQETTGAPPENFEGRTPQEMAESYHGKKGYPGTLEGSLSEVEKWRQGK